MFGKSKNEFPNDADGDALRLVARKSNLARPMVVDFQIATNSQESADSIARASAKLMYHTDVSKDIDEESSWTTTCTTRMLLNYESVIAIQAELHNLAKPLGGYADGWGTLGNDE